MLQLATLAPAGALDTGAPAAPQGVIAICGGSWSMAGHYSRMSHATATLANERMTRLAWAAAGRRWSRVRCRRGRRNTLGILILVPVIVALQFSRATPGGGASAGQGRWVLGPPPNVCVPASTFCTDQQYVPPLIILDRGPNAGKVLALGGFGPAPGFRQYGEFLDLVANTWSATAPLPSDLQASTATLLTDGTVLAVGYGKPGLYDPLTATWSRTGPMTSDQRQGQTATRLENGDVLVAGGANSEAPSPSSSEVYHPGPGGGTWTPTNGPMLQNRAGHVAVRLTAGPNKGKVLVAGGVGGGPEFNTLNTAELYDPATGTWSQTGSLGGPLGRYAPQNATVATLSNGQVLIAGGSAIGPTGRPFDPTVCPPGCTTYNLAELYDPSSGVWTATGSMSTPRSKHTASVLPDGRVLVAGGDSCCPPIVQSNPANLVEVYDPPAGAWVAGPPMKQGRSGHAAVLLPSRPASQCGPDCGSVVVVGGANSASAEFYVPPPMVTGITPAQGYTDGGDQVLVHGTGLAGTTTLSFGDASHTLICGPTSASACYPDPVTPETVLHVRATPAHAAGVVDVIDSSNPYPVNPADTQTSDPAPPDQFTYVVRPVPAVPPSVSGLSPGCGPLAGGTSVTVSGSGFNGVTAVRFGGVGGQFSVISDSQLVVTAPAQQAPASVHVVVSSSRGSSAVSAGDLYTYPCSLVTGGAPPGPVVTGGLAQPGYGNGGGFSGNPFAHAGGSGGFATVPGSVPGFTTVPGGVGGSATVSAPAPASGLAPSHATVQPNPALGVGDEEVSQPSPRWAMARRELDGRLAAGVLGVVLLGTVGCLMVARRQGAARRCRPHPCTAY